LALPQSAWVQGADASGSGRVLCAAFIVFVFLMAG